MTKGGKPVAALVNYEPFERISRMRDAFLAITHTLGHMYAGVDPNTAASEIQRALTAFRRERRR